MPEGEAVIELKRHVSFTVFGKCEPQGSSRQFRGRITSANPKLKPWRQMVADTMWVENHCLPFQGTGKESYRVGLHFALERPISVPKSRTAPTVKPDLDKLVRAILDSGTGILWKDDAQVIEIVARKVYGSPARVIVEIEEL